VQRGLYFRAGAWRDSVMYGLLRADWLSRATEE
jgi:RimJ/RimL family protein N-acetyltransferase